MRGNNFDGLRLLGALLVLVGHGFVLIGFDRAPRFAGIPIHTLGLYVFFTISGYLIYGSWTRMQKFGPYLRDRALRIFPGLVAVVLLTVFVIGPILSSKPAGAYFASPDTWKYLLNIFLVAQYQLPGVFSSNPHSDAVNGVLWTLGLEFICYLIVLACGLLMRSRVAFGLGVFGAVAAAMSFAPASSAFAWTVPIGQVWIFFALGALWRHGERLLRMSGWVVAAVGAAWVALGSLFPSWAGPIAWVALPYVVLSIGRGSWPVLRSSARFGDLSYGTYLWGYPTQQALLYLFPALAPVVSLTSAAAISLVLAFISWQVVEKRALRMKAMSPRDSAVPLGHVRQ